MIPILATLLPFGLTITEFLAVLTLAYVIAIAAFNSGYFMHVPSRFVELFSFSDLVDTNIPIFQYMLGLYFSYWLALPIVKGSNFVIAKGVDLVFPRLNPTSWPYWVGQLIDVILILSTFAFAAYWSHIMDEIKNPFFSLEFVPYLFAYFLVFTDLRVSYLTKMLSLKTVIFFMSLNAIWFCFLAGSLWLKYDIRTPKSAQAMYTNDGNCFDRIILRVTSSGYLLYSVQLRQFEFRNRNDFKVIYGNIGCS